RITTTTHPERQTRILVCALGPSKAGATAAIARRAQPAVYCCDSEPPRCTRGKTQVQPGADTRTDLDWQGSLPTMVRFFGPRRPGGDVDATFDLLTLSLLPGLQPRTTAALRARASAAEILADPEAHADLLSEGARRELRGGGARDAAEAEALRARRAGIAIVGRDEPDYPRLLREIADPPLILYVRGSVAGHEDEPAVAIVGSRAASPNGAALAWAMARELAAAGASVVSGFARGIDSAAHRGALEAGGRTLAVLGSGLECVYPAENAPLVARVAERGAVVSELPLTWGPRPGNFPRRNRIIAGLSHGVVVVEAQHKSGALITARLALEGGREVMAVP